MSANESLRNNSESRERPISQALLDAYLQDRVSSVVSQDAIRSVLDTLPRIQELNQRLQPLIQRVTWAVNQITWAVERERAIAAFQENDLWLAPSMPQAFVKKIVGLYSEGKSRVIPSMVARYYKKNHCAILKRAVARWESNPYFLPRMQIIKDALEAHISGKYTLTIPALLPHIEGIAREIVEQYRLSPLEPITEGGAKTYPTTAFGHVAASAFTFNEDVAISGLLRYLEGTLYVRMGQGFEKLPEFSKRKSRVNRHAILHGLQIDYASSTNSLRVFLALDVLSLLNPGKNP